MTTLLVTGAAGFIGSHVSEALLKQGFDVVGLDNMNSFYDPDVKQKNLLAIERTATQKGREFVFYLGDIRHQDLVAQIFKQHSIDAVIHLAAMAGVRPSFENPRLYVDVNELGTANLLEEVRRHKIKKFVFASSSSVYGNSPQVPFSEEHNVDHPVSIYAATKKAGEQLCYTYHNIYDLSIACLRFFTVYGPRQRPDLAIRKFLQLLLKEENLPVYGDGSKRRDYTYIDDIVDGVIAAYHWLGRDSKPCYDIFNLGNDKPVSVLEMISVLEKLSGKTAKPDFQADVAGDVQQTWADVRKARSILGYAPKVPLQDGLKNFLDWYHEIR